MSKRLSAKKRKEAQIRKIQKAGVEGEDTFDRGKELTDNPYRQGSIEALNWIRGWHKARHILRRESKKDESPT